MLGKPCSISSNLDGLPTQSVSQMINLNRDAGWEYKCASMINQVDKLCILAYLAGDHKRLALLDELHDPTPTAPSLVLAHDQLYSNPHRTIDHQISDLLAGYLSAKLISLHRAG
jgi:hypothetical protein